jgi:hypothetical protein
MVFLSRIVQGVIDEVGADCWTMPEKVYHLLLHQRLGPHLIQRIEVATDIHPSDKQLLVKYLQNTVQLIA